MDNSAPPPDNFMNVKVTIDFRNPNTLHDRVLLVEGKKFYVNSNFLAQFSEFFYGLFFSNFKEKDEIEIELKDVDATDVNNFLRLLYPLKHEITRDSIMGLIVLSHQWLCPTVWSLCSDFLQKKNEILNLPPRELLELSEQIDSTQVKKLVEESLIGRNNYYYSLSSPKLVDYFTLCEDFGLDKFKKALQEILSQPDLRRNHFFHELIDFSYTFELNYLKNKVERMLLSYLRSGSFNVMLIQALTNIFKEKMKFLKANMQIILTDLFTNDKSMNDLKKYLTLCKTYNLEVLETEIIVYIHDAVQLAKSSQNLEIVFDVADIIQDDNLKEKARIAIEKIFTDAIDKKQNLSTYLKVIQKYELDNLKDMVEAHFIENSKKVEGYQFNDILQFVDRFDLKELKKCLADRIQLVSLEEPHDLYQVLQALTFCSLPNLMLKVDKFLQDQLLEYADTGKFPALELMNGAEYKKLVAGRLLHKFPKGGKMLDGSGDRQIYYQLATQYKLPELMGYASWNSLVIALKDSLAISTKHCSNV